MKNALNQISIILVSYKSSIKLKRFLRKIPKEIKVFIIDNSKDYIFEPELISLLKSIAPKYVENQVFHSVLEAFASEHSARMVAMQNATDNANELVEGLTLDLNKARQESITGELLDIVGGVAALEK